MSKTVEDFLKNGGVITQVESVFDKTRKLTFEDQLNILLFAGYATLAERACEAVRGASD